MSAEMETGSETCRSKQFTGPRGSSRIPITRAIRFSIVVYSTQKCFMLYLLCLIRPHSILIFVYDKHEVSASLSLGVKR